MYNSMKITSMRVSIMYKILNYKLRYRLINRILKTDKIVNNNNIKQLSSKINKSEHNKHNHNQLHNQQHNQQHHRQRKQ